MRPERDKGSPNVYATQMIFSFPERLMARGMEVRPVCDQFRPVKGLPDVYSLSFYESRINDAMGTELMEREGARKALEWQSKVLKIKSEIPQLLVDITEGVCLRAPESTSRYEFHNARAMMHCEENSR